MFDLRQRLGLLPKGTKDPLGPKNLAEVAEAQLSWLTQSLAGLIRQGTVTLESAQAILAELREYCPAAIAEVGKLPKGRIEPHHHVLLPVISRKSIDCRRQMAMLVQDKLEGVCRFDEQGLVDSVDLPKAYWCVGFGLTYLESNGSPATSFQGRHPALLEEVMAIMLQLNRRQPTWSMPPHVLCTGTKHEGNLLMVVHDRHRAINPRYVLCYTLYPQLPIGDGRLRGDKIGVGTCYGRVGRGL
ncbi:MAG: hypothetical protein WCX71_01760 [Candidatus Buchananbacteria bacterium]